MKKWPFFILILTAGILQISILEGVKIFYLKPDLLLILAVLASLQFDAPQAIAAAITCGVLKDIFGAGFFGYNAILFGVWSLLIIHLARQISIDNNYLRTALIFIVCFVHNLMLGLLFIARGSSIPLGIFLRIVILGSLYTALVVPLLVRALKVVYPQYNY